MLWRDFKKGNDKKFGNNTSKGLKYNGREPYRYWPYKDAQLGILQGGVEALKV